MQGVENPAGFDARGAPFADRRSRPERFPLRSLKECALLRRGEARNAEQGTFPRGVGPLVP